MGHSLYPTGMARSLTACFILFLTLFTAGCATTFSGSAQRNVASAQTVVDEATATLRGYLEGERKAVVSQLISEAKGVMIVPGMGSVSFFFSIGGGNALVMARSGDDWSGPVFLSKGTGGLGVQAGVTKTSGIIFYMNEDDVRYVLETGAVMQGRAAITFLDADFEENRTPDFAETGDVVFIGDTSGLYAGVGVNAGGLSNRDRLNAAYHGVENGAPQHILYTEKSVPTGAGHLRNLLEMADESAARKTKKDGTEVPSN